LDNYKGSCLNLQNSRCRQTLYSSAILLWAVILALFPGFQAIAEDLIILPKPHLEETVSLEEALNRSQTVRNYSEKPLDISELSYVLWAAEGRRYDAVTSATRTYPSAGRVYPVRLYVLVANVEAIKPGVYQYVSADHALKLLKS
jgi:hypothetical protein